MNWLRSGLLLFAVTQSPNAIFINTTVQAGIQWRHQNGESPEHYLVESTTGGAGFFDFDNDGLLDIFLVTGKQGAPCALYRNLGSGRFENVSVKAGLARMPFYGMGVAAADFDNDGFTDIYVTGYPEGALFHNNGNGTFTKM